VDNRSIQPCRRLVRQAENDDQLLLLDLHCLPMSYMSSTSPTRRYARRIGWKTLCWACISHARSLCLRYGPRYVLSKYHACLPSCFIKPNDRLSGFPYEVNGQDTRNKPRSDPKPTRRCRQTYIIGREKKLGTCLLCNCYRWAARPRTRHALKKAQHSTAQHSTRYFSLPPSTSTTNIPSTT